MTIAADIDAIAIRAAGPQDLDALVALEERAFASDRISRRSYARFLRQGHAACLVAELDEGQVVGSAVVLFRSGTSLARLYSIAVDPEVHRRGIARALLKAAEDEAVSRGVVVMRLEVRSDNRSAIALYESAGYRAFGRLLDFYEDHAEAVRYQKRLEPGGPTHDLRIPYYAQTTNFTCGAAALLMAFRRHAPDMSFGRREEYELWREATTIYMTSGHGGCDPFGLAVAAASRGFAVTVFVSNDDLLFLDGVRSEAKREVMRVVQEDFRAKALALGVEVRHRAMGRDDLERALAAGEVPVVLISHYRMYGQKNPHWVVVNGLDDRFVYIHDPWIDEASLETPSLKVNLPIPRWEFDRMAKFGRTQLKAAVMIGRQTAR